MIEIGLPEMLFLMGFCTLFGFIIARRYRINKEEEEETRKTLEKKKAYALEKVELLKIILHYAKVEVDNELIDKHWKPSGEDALKLLSRIVENYYEV